MKVERGVSQKLKQGLMGFQLHAQAQGKLHDQEHNSQPCYALLVMAPE